MWFCVCVCKIGFSFFPCLCLHHGPCHITWYSVTFISSQLDSVIPASASIHTTSPSTKTRLTLHVDSPAICSAPHRPCHRMVPGRCSRRLLFTSQNIIIVSFYYSRFSPKGFYGPQLFLSFSITLDPYYSLWFFAFSHFEVQRWEQWSSIIQSDKSFAFAGSSREGSSSLIYLIFKKPAFHPMAQFMLTYFSSEIKVGSFYV